MGKITLGKILSEILGQYFFRLFKARDRIFPLFLRKVESPLHTKKILRRFAPDSERFGLFSRQFFPDPRGQNFFRAFLSSGTEFFPPPFKGRDRIFSGFLRPGTEFFPAEFFLVVIFPGPDFQLVWPRFFSANGPNGPTKKIQWPNLAQPKNFNGPTWSSGPF